MRTVGAYEAKTNLAQILDEVELGKTVTITRHGREVARLVPAHGHVGSPDEVISELLAERVGRRRGRTSVRAMKLDGRR